MTTAPRHVVIVGLMASGKSSVGRIVAARLGRPFVDNDEVLEARTGHKARDIATTEGAAVLHDQEAEALVAALARPVPAVIAAAAAAPLEPSAARALRAHDVVYLRVAPGILVARLAAEPDDGHRPFVDADAAAVLAEQFDRRDPVYRDLATAVIDAGSGGPDRIAAEVVAAISSAPAP